LVRDAGGALNLYQRCFLNADIKYLNALRSNVEFPNGSTLTTARLDPLLYSLGVGYHF
jgi:outer membrane protein W